MNSRHWYSFKSIKHWELLALSAEYYRCSAHWTWWLNAYLGVCSRWSCCGFFAFKTKKDKLETTCETCEHCSVGISPIFTILFLLLIAFCLWGFFKHALCSESYCLHVPHCHRHALCLSPTHTVSPWDPVGSETKSKRVGTDLMQCFLFLSDHHESQTRALAIVL